MQESSNETDLNLSKEVTRGHVVTGCKCCYGRRIAYRLTESDKPWKAGRKQVGGVVLGTYSQNFHDPLQEIFAAPTEHLWRAA